MIKSKQTKQNEMYAILIVIIAIILIISALVFNYNPKSAKSATNADYTQIPTIYIPLNSSDGSLHNLSAEFYIDIPEETREKASVEDIKATISNILENSSYEALSQKDIISTITEEIKDKLQNSYPDLNIKDIYVENFLIDFTLSEPTTSNIYEMFRPN